MKNKAMRSEFDLENAFNHEEIPKAKKPVSRSNLFTIAYLIFVFIFIYNYMTALNITQARSMGNAIKNIFELRPYNLQSEQYQNISSKDDISDFVIKVVFPQIYDENLKEYYPMVDGYHFLNYYNFFMGIRITHNRVKLKENTQEVSKDVISHIRKTNYKGSTSRRFGDLDKSNFGSENTEYSKNGGYRGKGGFIHFFEADIDFNEANTKMNQLIQDGVFDEQAVTFTIEIMFYNQNYQIGTIQIYEFLIDNSGNIEKYSKIDSFMLSRYSNYYNLRSGSWKGFMYFLD